ncbi:hypothetical protein BOX15_Mlig008288g1, partial [Macrostomum lignano]
TASMSNCSSRGAALAPEQCWHLRSQLLPLLLLLLLNLPLSLCTLSANECPDLVTRFNGSVSSRPRYFFASVSDSQPLPVSVCGPPDAAGLFTARVVAALLTDFFRYRDVQILSRPPLHASSCTIDMGL